jgi:hypothetical protein
MPVLGGDFMLRILKGFKATVDQYEDGVTKILIDCSSRILRGYNAWAEFIWFLDKLRDEGMSKQ